MELALGLLLLLYGLATFSFASWAWRLRPRSRREPKVALTFDDGPPRPRRPSWTSWPATGSGPPSSSPGNGPRPGPTWWRP